MKKIELLEKGLFIDRTKPGMMKGLNRISPIQKYEKLFKTLKKAGCVVVAGSSLVGTARSVMNCVVGKSDAGEESLDANANTVWMTLSVSHAIADGHT